MFCKRGHLVQMFLKQNNSEIIAYGVRAGPSESANKGVIVAKIQICLCRPVNHDMYH